MQKIARKVALVLGASALVVALAVQYSPTSNAANLTGGNYAYVINGEEVTFPYDPIVRQSGVLLPIEVYQQFGITVENPLTKSMTLRKEQVSAVLTLGTTTITLNGQSASVATPPLRLNGRLFISADLLKEFGVESTTEGNYVIMRSYVDGTPTVKQVTDSDFNAFKTGRVATGSMRLDSNIYASSELTLLSNDIVSASTLNLSYGARARLQSLLLTNTLVMVKLSNTSFKSGALTLPGLYLVDDQRNQYDLASAIDLGLGLVTNKLAPGADRVGVLVFPKLNAAATNITVYYDANGGSLGTFTTIK
jgi:hypothetical protein